jgi:inorganic triphosphatase YgiF
MRFRTGEGGSGTWTVKLPEGEDGPALVRREVPVPGPAGTPPAEAVALVRAYVRSAPLVAVARLRTRRHGVALKDGEGHLLAEVVDDEVTVMEGRKAAARFREVEVEIDARAPDGLLTDVIARLRAAGAGAPDPTSKVVRALGDRASAPPEVAAVRLGDRPAAGAVVKAAIAASVIRVLIHDAGVRLGDDPEDVHQARVGTRRLRSDLRTFRSVLDQEWVEPLRAELKWIADLLGAVRDADVLGDRLRAQAAELPEVDAAGFAPVLRRLADEREGARTKLLEAMDGPRYVVLLDRLVLAAQEPVFLAGAAAKPARKVLTPLVATSWR